MAMTAAEWARFQARIPVEDRTTYEQYLASIGAATNAGTSQVSAAEAIRAAEQRAFREGERSAPVPTTSMVSAASAISAAERRAFRAGERGDVLPQQVVTPPVTTPVTPANTGAATGAVTGSATGSTTSSTTGGITQEQLDAAIASAVQAALAKQQAEFARVQKENANAIAAQREAEKQSTRQKASDRLVAMFKGYDLGALATYIDEQIKNDVSEDMLMLQIYERPEYKTKFPGMEALRKAGKTITEKEYMGIEKQMQQTARFFDLPAGFYDGPEDFGDLIGKQVSAKEFQDRLQVGQDLARSLNPQVKQALTSLYGVGEGAITAYVLNADRALSLIQKQAKAAQFVGMAREQGFGLRDITAEAATNIAGTTAYASLSEQQLQKSLQQAGQLRKEQSRLAGIEGAPYNEQEALDAVIAGSPNALLASQQRAQREVARFSQRGGVTGTSLARTEVI
jgi:hypothetical protein